MRGKVEEVVRIWQKVLRLGEAEIPGRRYTRRILDEMWIGPQNVDRKMKNCTLRLIWCVLLVNCSCKVP